MKEGLEARHRMRLSQTDAHYGGDLVAGGHLLELFGDVATELCVRSDGDEGLLAGYSDVRFLEPVYAGDFVEIVAKIIRAGETSREMSFQVLRYASPRPDISDSAAELALEPELVATATGTCVVKKERQRR
jgi:3-aminobutyryl-CoA ammonia-lyase